MPGSQADVRVIMIGYRPVAETVAVGRTDLLFELSEAAVALDQIVVTGTAGGQRSRAIGNVVGTLDAAELQEIAPATDVQQMLNGQVPGVRIMSTGGAVGTGGVMRIRGAASVSLAGDPLVYIDGVRVSGGSTGGVGTFAFPGGRAPNRINDLNPNDIESIEVIKGPAAATLYGTEASNGVIQIITKKGAPGAPRVSLDMSYGAYWLPDAINYFPPTYYRCSGVSNKPEVDPRLQCEPGEIVPVNVLALDKELRGQEWFHTGHSPSFATQVTGGTETVRYFFSGGWSRQEGYVPYNWKNGLTGRASLGYTPTEQLSFDFNLGFVRSRAQTATPQQAVTTAIMWACPAPGCEAGTGLPGALDGERRGYIGYLPEIYEDEIEAYQDVDRTTAGLTVNYNPFEWFTHRLTIGGDFTNLRDTELFRATGSVGNSNNEGSKEVGSSRGLYVTTDYAASAIWNATPDFTLTTSAGAQFYQRTLESASAEGERFALEALETVSSGAVRTASEDFQENKTFGVYFQEQVGWNDRVFVTAAVRGDDNSAFGENFNFVVYPKFSASWVLSEEPFLADLDWLNTLRLRTAWGRAGQQPDVFDAVRTYEPIAGYEGEAAITPENIGNPDLKPEVGDEWEVGFDAGLLDDRLSIQFTGYRQRTIDALIRVPVLPSLGFPGVQLQNLGEIRNQGIELSVNAGLYRGADATFDLGVSLSSAENEVVELGSQPFVIQSVGNGQYNVEGFPIASLFGRRVVSAEVVEPGSVTDVMCEGGERVPGTNFSRGGGAPVPCADAPDVYWGQPLPEWEGSVSGNLTLFQNLTIYGLVDFIHGRTWLNGDIRSAHQSFLNTLHAVQGTDPILEGYYSLGQEGRPQIGMMSGDFAKLRVVSASYRLPQSWAQRVGASSLDLTVSGQNLATLWQGTTERFGHRVIAPERADQTGGETAGLDAETQEGFPLGKRIITTLRVIF